MLEASRVGIASTLEPVVAIIVAYLTLGESLNAVQVFGSAGVMSAILLLRFRPDHIRLLIRRSSR